MKRENSIFWMVVATLVGMVGLYVGATYAYIRYKQESDKLGKLGTVGGALGTLFGGG